MAGEHATRRIPAPVRPDLSEEQWQQVVLDYATLKGWKHYHTRDSRRSAKGFPDLTLVRDRRLVFAELKRAGEKPTSEQLAWLEALKPVAEVYVWRPGDLQAVLKLLA